MNTSRTFFSYHLTFFDKLVQCCGLKFSIPQPRTSAIEIQATFEKAYWKLEPKLSGDKKELAAATLRSIALNYIERRGPKPPKTLSRSIQHLKKRDNIIITKPNKVLGVVVISLNTLGCYVTHPSMTGQNSGKLTSGDQVREVDHQSITTRSLRRTKI